MRTHEHAFFYLFAVRSSAFVNFFSIYCSFIRVRLSYGMINERERTVRWSVRAQLWLKVLKWKKLMLVLLWWCDFVAGSRNKLDFGRNETNMPITGSPFNTVLEVYFHHFNEGEGKAVKSNLNSTFWFSIENHLEK